MGYFLALLTAIVEAVRIAVSKHGLKTVDEYFLTWALRLVATIIIFPLVISTGIPALGRQFWLAATYMAISSSISTILYLKAINTAPISLTTPMLSFTPLFVLLTGSLIIGEFPSLIGLIGSLIIVFGAYILQPFHLSLKQTGTRLMLVVALIWAVDAPMHKIGIVNSSVMFWTLTQFLGPAILLLPFLPRLTNKRIKVFNQWRVILLIGALTALGQIFQMESFKLILAVYSLAIKRTAVLFTVLLGWWFFKETEIKKRLAGAGLMILGILLISFYG